MLRKGTAATVAEAIAFEGRESGLFGAVMLAAVADDEEAQRHAIRHQRCVPVQTATARPDVDV